MKINYNHFDIREVIKIDKFEKLLAKIEELRISTDKAFNKGNKAQARKARQETMDLRDIINELRVELLAVYTPKA